MELIYMYIKKFDNFIENQEITFTNNFDVTLKDGILKVEKKENLLSHLYSSNIKNITVMNGKNGTGKSTILDILGMNSNFNTSCLRSTPGGQCHQVIIQYLSKSMNKENKSI
jgi:putative ribosome biogenesis GTPase RsgA